MPRKPRTYRLSPRARDDLEQIWLYTYKTWSLAQADGYFDEIMAAIEALTRGEATARRVDVRDGYLKYAVGQHFVFFKSSDAHIDVVRILHQRMDVDRHL